MVTCFTAFVIAGLCSLAHFGGCLELPQDDLSQVVTSKIFEKKVMSYIEDAENNTHSNLKDPPENEYIPKMELVTPGPLFEDMLWNTSDFKETNRKRGVPDRGLSHELEMQILQLHNIYRGNVTPPAGDMAYMEWDVKLARHAQLWSDGCVFDHGYPEDSLPGDMTQNLYMGTDPTGSHGIWLWYEEYKNYDVQKTHCIPGKVCGHFIAMAWAESNRVGCGITRCKSRYYLTCYYSPGAFGNMQIYRIAKPCSQCSSRDGSLCLQNLCISREQCKRNPFNCKFAKCNLKCLNCGRLNKENCTCECPDGWDSPDCSISCTNQNKRCLKTPGYPNKSTCSMSNFTVANKHCRKMCGKCNTVNELSNYTCCNGTLCEDGYVLDTDEKPCKGSCQCKPLCPGSMCEHEDEDSNRTCCNASLCEDGYVLDMEEGWCQCKPRCPGPMCDKEKEHSNYTCCNGTVCEDGYVLDADEKTCKGSCQCKPLCSGSMCDKEKELSNYTCCNGTVCEDGYVLDADEKTCKGSCQCKPLCSGSMCDEEETVISSAVLENNSAVYSRLDFVLLVWIFVTWSFVS